MKQHRIAALFLALLLTACSGGGSGSAASSSSQAAAPAEDELPRPIPFSLAVYPEFSLHPTLAANRANLTLAPLLYESLFTVDSSFQAQPLLCQSYTISEDKLSWTFVLHSGVTFSDGTPLTGQLAADALELARSSAGRYRQRLDGIAAITAEEATPDRFTITLRRPNGSLPLLLDIPIALGEGDRPAGTGPYMLTGSGDSISLTARSNWWQKEKTLPTPAIPLHSVSKSDELIYAFDAGEISLVDVDLMATNAMGYGGNYQTWDYPTTDLIYLGFNTREGLCRSQELRGVIALAVDRNAVASAIYASHAVPAPLPVHPASGLYSQSAAAAAPSYSPEQLASWLEEQRTQNWELTLLVNSENVSKASAARQIAYQLEAAGLTVKLEQLPFEDYSAALTRGEFDLYIGETVLTADFDLSPLLSSSGALNYGGWWDEAADGLLYAMQSAAPEDKPAAAEAVFALLNEHTPIVPIVFKNGSVLTQWGRLSGLSPVRGNVFYRIENWSLK